MDKPIIYVGLDVHKDTIAVALAEAGKRGEVRQFGRIANTPAALKGRRRDWLVVAAICGSVTRPDLVATGSNGN
jgi:hypothetical protein